MKKYVYYVSLVHPKGSHIGRGYIEVPRTIPITQFSDIADMAAGYNKQFGNGDEYVLSDYGLLRVEETAPEVQLDYDCSGNILKKDDSPKKSNQVMKYFYFVSYNFTDDKGFGLGRCEVTKDADITSFEDITNIENLLKTSYGYKSLLLINFQLMRVEKSEPEGRLEKENNEGEGGG